MHLTTYLNSNFSEDLFALYQQFPSLDLLLSTREFSRFGLLSLKEANTWAQKLKEKKIRAFFDWDILSEEHKWSEAQEKLKKIPWENYTGLRLQDPGALEYVLELKESYPHLKIQLILETGHRNLIGIKKWSDYLGPCLDRLILSSEIPKSKLFEIASLIKIPIEVLGLGRILLFYSPRKLLTPLFPGEEMLSVEGTSEESPHRGFPIIENNHGSFMFHVKDLCLLENLEELEGNNISSLRVDDRFVEKNDLIVFWKNLLNYWKTRDQEVLSLLKNMWPSPLIQGFFRANKSDVLFKKLKNHRLSERNQNFIGEVIEARRDRPLAILVKGREIKLGDVLRIQTPDGKEKITTVCDLKNFRGESLTHIETGDVAIVPPMGGVSIKSFVYQESSR